MHYPEQRTRRLHKYFEVPGADFNTGTPKKSRILQPDQGFILRLRGQVHKSVLSSGRFARRVAPGTRATRTDSRWIVDGPAVAGHVRESPSQPRSDRRGTRGCIRLDV